MRLLYALSAIMFIFLIVGCSASGEELFTGKYINDETIEFSEHKITDQDQINMVKEILDSGKKMTEQNDFSRLPDVVVRIDHKNDSIMVLASSIWFNDDTTATYYRGLDYIGEKELYIISEEETERLKSNLP